jgi:TonB family protein
MIAAWMLYCVGIGLAFVIAGHALERALHWAGRPTRWAWCLALAGSLLVPAAAWLVPDAFRTLSVPMPERMALTPIPHTGSGVSAATAIGGTGSRGLAPSDLDRPLTWIWGLASAALLGTLAIAALRLAVLRRRWRAAMVDGRRVLVSDNVGPAVAGVWEPRIVIPGWALQLTEHQRSLILTHEEEHLLARDPRLLACGALALLVAPWNFALWWQVRRLRLAVEMDCDARVLGRGHQGPAYGELLLQVGQRRARLPLGAPALGEPVSFLECRIRRMAGALPRWRWLGAGAAAVIAAGAIIGACEAPRPVNPEQAGDRAAEASKTPESSVSLQVQMPSTLERVPSRGVLIRWMRAAITQTYAEYLTNPANPPVDLWFHGTTGGRVVQSTRTVGRRVARLRYGEIEAHLPELRPNRPGVWFGWAYPLGPGREDVRAIWADDGGDSESVTPRGQGQAPPGLTRSVVDGREVLSGPRIQYEGPALLSGPPLQYPELLRHAGIEGRVIVQAIIDTTGRAEPASVKVIESPNPGFDQAAINWVRRALFRPARVNGQAVRALMKMPIEFK